MKYNINNLFFVSFFSPKIKKLETYTFLAEDIQDLENSAKKYFNFLSISEFHFFPAINALNWIEEQEKNQNNKEDIFLIQVFIEQEESIKLIEKTLVCKKENLESEILRQHPNMIKYLSYNYYIIYSFLSLIQDYLNGLKNNDLLLSDKVLNSI